MIYVIHFKVENLDFADYVSMNMHQYNRPRVHGFEPVVGVVVDLSSNKLNIDTFVHQMGDV